MRLAGYINEGEADKTALALKNVVKECSDYFDEVKSIKIEPFIYRGVKNVPKKLIEKRIPRAGRAPKDTPLLIHDIMDTMLEDKFGWKPRSSAAFTAAGDTAGNYGQRYIFIPSNGYKYIWCTKKGYEDMFAVFDHEEYDPATYDNGKMVWKSKTKKSTFNLTADMDDAMELLGYVRYITTYNKITYKNNVDDELIIYKLVSNSSDEQKLKAINMAVDEIKEKGTDYVKHCIDTGLVKAMKIAGTSYSDTAEIMFKCNYYYLISRDVMYKFEAIIQGRV